jgi:hypothetical protein
MPDLSRDPNRRSRFAIAVLPITAPLFIISATRVFPNGRLGIDAAVYGSVCGLFASVALFVAWPVLLKPDASQSSVKLMDMTLTVLAFVVSVTWIHAASQELVALTFAAGMANAGGEVQKSVSHPTRSASAIGPITGDCSARLRVTVYSYQSLIHMARKTDTFFCFVSGVGSRVREVARLGHLRGVPTNPPVVPQQRRVLHHGHRGFGGEARAGGGGDFGPGRFRDPGGSGGRRVGGGRVRRQGRKVRPWAFPKSDTRRFCRPSLSAPRP